MSSIAEFPYYKQRENLVTNNTMLFLRKLYHYKALYFQMLLEDLFEGSDSFVGPQFHQQIVEGGSIPDGAISQSSFEIRIETKLNSTFDLGQIERHLEIGEERRPLLVMLSRGNPSAAHRETIRTLLEKYGVRYCFLTFSKLVDAVSDLVQEYEIGLSELVEGYYEFLDKADLIDLREVTLRAVCSGGTKKDNIEHRAYATYASRGFRSHKYIGLYWEKSVRQIGRITAVVTVQRDNPGQWTMKPVIPGVLSEESMRRIQVLEGAHKIGSFYRNSDFSIPHNVFLVDEFIETDFNKTSKYPIQSVKYFNLSEVLEHVPETTTELGIELREKSWE